jgi:pSer/pThr/pTyr-binding forkhead associated (FHA) protein
LDSTNGTLINHERLSIPIVVVSGDEFHCGDTLISITLTSEFLKPLVKAQSK